MYNPNCTKDLFLSQTWSQNDSQDWNTQLVNSQDFCHQVPSTPTARSRVLPPTPSSSGLQSRPNSLSSGWSGSNNVSQPMPPSRAPRGGESIFSREIRFALHALLSVVKELPDKLKDVVLNATGNRATLDETLFENIKKILDEKLVSFERLLTLTEANEVFAGDCRKSHGIIQGDIEKVHEFLCSHEDDVAALQRNFNVKTDALTKQMTSLRKLFLRESKKLQGLLLTVKNDRSENCEIVLKMDDVLGELQTLTKTSSECNEEISRYVHDEKDKENSNLIGVMEEISSVKKILEKLPTMINTSLKENYPASSPVARISPQIHVRPPNSVPKSSEVKVDGGNETTKGAIAKTKNAFGQFEYASSCDDSPKSSTVTRPPKKQEPSVPFQDWNKHSAKRLRSTPAHSPLEKISSFTPTAGGDDVATSFGSRKSVKDGVFISRPQTRVRSYF